MNCLLFFELVLFGFQNVFSQKIVIKAKKASHQKSSVLHQLSSFSLINFLNEQYVGELSIGTPPQSITLILSTSFYLFAIQNRSNSMYSSYLTNDSSSFSYNQYNTAFFFHNNSYQHGVFANESFIFESGTPSMMLDFFLTNKNGHSDNSDGILGLDYADYSQMHFHNQSLIENLYNKQLIKSKIFTFQYSTSEDSPSILSIGDIDKEIISSSKRYHTFKLLDDSFSINWAVNGTKVYFGQEALNNSLSSKTKFRFAFEHAFIMAPIKLQIFLRENYLLSYIKNGDCIENKSFGTIWFECNMNIDISNLEPLNFLIQGYEFTLEPHELFVECNSTKIFVVCVNNKGAGMKEDWLIGEPFMRKYQVVYDKEKDMIGIYNPKGLVYLGIGDFSEDNNNYLISIVIVSIVLGLVIIICCVFRKIRLNKIQNRDMYDQLTKSTSSPFRDKEVSQQ